MFISVSGTVKLAEHVLLECTFYDSIRNKFRESLLILFLAGTKDYNVTYPLSSFEKTATIHASKYLETAFRLRTQRFKMSYLLVNFIILSILMYITCM